MDCSPILIKVTALHQTTHNVLITSLQASSAAPSTISSSAAAAQSSGQSSASSAATAAISPPTSATGFTRPPEPLDQPSPSW